MVAPTRLDDNAVLSARVDLSPTLAIFRVRPDDGVPVGDAWFTPGQYVTVGINNDARPELGGVERPMSIASAPHEHRFLEFYIRRITDPVSANPLTRLLWGCPVGNRLFVRLRPKGRFTIDDTVDRDDRRMRVLVAAGTGLAPFMSMVRSAAYSAEQTLERYAVLHGASFAHELGYREELEELSRSRGLRYLPTVSRPDDQWHGDTGRVDDFFRPQRIGATEHLLGLRDGALGPREAVVYVCGLRGTVEQVLRRLLTRGFIPGDRRLRSALGFAESVPGSLFWEQYDREPITVSLDDTDARRQHAK